ncbi:MAG: hypothetical protein QM755_02785 [Luteolibacter sp.]
MEGKKSARESERFLTVCVFFWTALAMAVVAHFMVIEGVETIRIYQLWRGCFEVVRTLGTEAHESWSAYEGLAGFAIGSFCVAAAPWCVRILYQSEPLRWICRVMVFAGALGVGRQLDGGFREGVGLYLLVFAMVMTLLGLILIRGRREEVR